jgi:hypothetical protein
MLRIFSPRFTPEIIEGVTKGEIQYATIVRVPKQSRLIGCLPTPSLIEVLGGQGPGGPVGYAYWIDDVSAPVFPRLMFHVEPEVAYPELQSDDLMTVAPLGIAMFKGMLLGHVEGTTEDMPKLIARLAEKKYAVVESYPYVVPDEFKKTLAARAEAATKFAGAIARRGTPEADRNS